MKTKRITQLDISYGPFDTIVINGIKFAPILENPEFSKEVSTRIFTDLVTAKTDLVNYQIKENRIKTWLQGLIESPPWDKGTK